MKWVLATRNKGKVNEFQRLADELGGGIAWLSLDDVQFLEEVEEAGGAEGASVEDVEREEEFEE